MYVRGNRVDDVSALGDNLMDPDRILLPEGLPAVSHGVHRQAGHVEGVDPVPGRGARVGLPAHEHGVLAMADCSTYEECVNAENIGFDCVSTTLCGYTPYSKNVDGPNLELFKKLAETIKAPILAEGKINTPEDLAAVYEAGAYSAVVGGAITRPKQITERFVKALKK